jgi:hypothetical protein
MFSKEVNDFIKKVEGKKKEIEAILGDKFEYSWELEGTESVVIFPYYSLVARRSDNKNIDISFIFHIEEQLDKLLVTISYIGDDEKTIKI